MLQAQGEAETVLNEVRNLLDTLRQLIETSKLTADTYRLDGYENELNQLKNKWENVKTIVLENADYYEIAQEEFKEVIRETSELKLRIQGETSFTEEKQVETLPTSWLEIQPETIYQIKTGMLVSFSKKQILFAKNKDRDGNHLRAIDKGEVPSQGHQGLVRSEEPGFDFKSKVLGKSVSHYRFHAKIINDVLHFPGKVTNKK